MRTISECIGFIAAGKSMKSLMGVGQIQVQAFVITNPSTNQIFLDPLSSVQSVMSGAIIFLGEESPMTL